MNIEIPKTTETDDIFDYGFDKNLIRVAEQDSKTASEKTAVYNSLTDSVSASLITSGDLKSEITMIDGHLQSANYVAGTTGWRMDADGNLDANTGTFRGDITIGTGNNVFKADSNGIYLGDATYASAPFRVSMAGALVASSVNVSGAITTGVGSDIKGEYIESLSVSKLTTGEIKSKQITLSFTDNDGDCYIAAGKTDFDHDETGFIMGIDDSDSNKVKFIIGTPTEYLMVDGNTMYNTLIQKYNFVGNWKDGFIETKTGTADIYRFLMTTRLLASKLSAGNVATLTSNRLTDNADITFNNSSLDFAVSLTDVCAGGSPSLENSFWGIVLFNSTNFAVNSVPNDATSVAVHVGFFVDDGILYASNANGATQTKTDLSSGINISNNHSYRIIYTTSSIKFYIDDILKTTHTTNIPSNNASDIKLYFGTESVGSTSDYDPQLIFFNSYSIRKI